MHEIVSTCGDRKLLVKRQWKAHLCHNRAKVDFFSETRILNLNDFSKWYHAVVNIRWFEGEFDRAGLIQDFSQEWLLDQVQDLYAACSLSERRQSSTHFHGGDGPLKNVVSASGGAFNLRVSDHEVHWRRWGAEPERSMKARSSLVRLSISMYQ